MRFSAAVYTTTVIVTLIPIRFVNYNCSLTERAYLKAGAERGVPVSARWYMISAAVPPRLGGLI